MHFRAQRKQVAQQFWVILFQDFASMCLKSSGDPSFGAPFAAVPLMVLPVVLLVAPRI
jgi:hypothetical protein